MKLQRSNPDTLNDGAIVIYYNEYDPGAAEGLRRLMKAGLIPKGYVDERSIEDVRPSDLADYTQCHFFAGIGGWSLALQLAGIPESTRLWTGSCPCQPYSQAGEGAGQADERHLWPAFFHLIEVCRPGIVLGEQVASKDADQWYDLVQTDLEGLGYAFGALAFPAASVGTPHTRDRGYWAGVTDSSSLRVPRQGQAGISGTLRQGWPGWATDLQQVYDSPFAPGRGHPQPLLRRMDDGFSTAVVGLSAFGNAIVPQQAAEFISALMEFEDAP